MQAAMFTMQYGQPRVDIGGNPFVTTAIPCKDEGAGKTDSKQIKRRESGIKSADKSGTGSKGKLTQQSIESLFNNQKNN